MKRLIVLLVGIGVASAILAGPAWAHIEVEARPASPGAADAVLAFTAKSESKTAGITKLEILADPAIAADQITLVEGPTGWKMGSSSQGGFVVEGPGVPAGQDAKLSVKVKQLPNTPEVVFKTLQSYSDGRIDRWIELAGPDGKEPEMPAPIVKLAAGAQSAVSENPKNDEDEDATAEAADTHGGSLVRTGSPSRTFTVFAGLLLVMGGASIAAGTRRTRRATE
jgi:hypothetical protein